MKGIVFTELLDMVESTFDANLVDDTLNECTLESGGAYTAVGTYDHRELLQIVTKLSEKTNLSVKDLIHKYAHHLFVRFSQIMPQFFEKPTNSFEFLETVHDTIHVEVKKLYPDAALPHFETKRMSDDIMVMIYKSKCPFADLAHGLIEGCAQYYNEHLQIKFEDKNTDETYCRIFTLIKG